MGAQLPPPDTLEGVAMDAADARVLLEREYGLVEEVVSWACRRHGLSGDDADSFASYVRFRLVEDDYRMIRRFEGRSTLRTYLTVLVANSLADFRVKNWGRWRPSAAARRMGAAGVLLDSYINRDGVPLEEAIEMILERDDVSRSRTELHQLARRIPRRTRRSFQPLDGETPLESAHRADERVETHERDKLWAAAKQALDRALMTLPEQDRLVVQLHLGEGMTLAAVARTLKLPQKPLYRRLRTLRSQLENRLRAEGVDRAFLHEVLPQ